LNIGYNYQAWSKYDSSYIYFNKGYEIYNELTPGMNENMANVYYKKASLFDDWGKYDSSIYYYDLSFEIYRNLYGEKDITIANVYNNMGLVYQKQLLFSESKEYFEKCLSLRLEILGSKHKDIASSYYNISELYFYKSEYDSAILYANKCVELRKEILGEQNLSVGYAYLQLGNLYRLKENFTKALEYAELADNLFIQVLGENNIDISSAKMNIGRIFLNTGKLEKAYEYHKKAFDMALDFYGEYHPLMIWYYTNYAVYFAEVGNPDKAIELQQKVIKICENEYADNNQTRLDAQYYMAYLLYNNSKYSEAKKLLIDYQLKIIKYYGEFHSNISDVNNLLGLINNQLGDYDQAFENYIKAAEICKKVKGENNIDLNNIYMNIANLYKTKAKYKEALEYYNKSMEILKLYHEETYSGFATNYINLAFLYTELNEYETALEYFNAALALLLNISGENNRNIPYIYAGIGKIYDNKGMYEQALQYTNKSINLFKVKFGENHSITAEAFQNLANIYYHSNKYQLAIQEFNNSLKIFNTIYDEVHPSIAECYNSLANCYIETNDIDKALENYQKAIDIFKIIYQGKHPQIAKVYNNIGDYNLKFGKYEEALQSYQEAMIANVIPFNEKDIFLNPIINNYLDHTHLLHSLKSKARILTELFQKNKSINYLELSLTNYQLCDSLMDKMRQSFTKKSDKIALGDTAFVIYDEAITVCKDLYNYTDNKKYLEQAFYLSERNKGSVLLEALAGVEAQKFAGIPDSLLLKEQLLKEDIAFYQKELAQDIDSLKRASYQNNLFKLNQEYNTLITGFEKNFPEYFDLKYSSRSATIKDIQKLLNRKTAIQSYFIGKDELTVFQVTKNKIEMNRVPVGEELYNEVSLLRDGIIYGFNSTYATSYQDVAYPLYRKLFPIEIKKRITNLIMIPDGSLGVIPFEALLTKPYVDTITGVIQFAEEEGERGATVLGTIEREAGNYKDYPFLIKKYNISYSYSANLFFKTFPKQKTKEPEFAELNDWLALAPVFVESNTAGLDLKTKNLLAKMNEMSSDTIATRGELFRGDY
ncbi:MAG: tetratricopeptide repeat protein, partial [Bacteroidales bacterium]|nr:tetratricopeptide repeat protein [Bacteroidales bacterium]